MNSISSSFSKKEKKAIIAATIKGLFGINYATKLINWLDPCCPFQIDPISAEEASKFNPLNWTGSLIYINSTNNTFPSEGFYQSVNGVWEPFGVSASLTSTTVETVTVDTIITKDVIIADLTSNSIDLTIPAERTKLFIIKVINDGVGKDVTLIDIDGRTIEYDASPWSFNSHGLTNGYYTFVLDDTNNWIILS